jgi:hypothetical protein
VWTEEVGSAFAGHSRSRKRRWLPPFHAVALV